VCGSANCEFAQAEMQESIPKAAPILWPRRRDCPSLPSLGGMWKRVIDAMVAGLALVVLTPIMLMTAIVVRLWSDEPIILSERLLGRGGRVFVGYKFRIPVANAEGPMGWTECVAEGLRRSNLDQLPRLFNVLRGDMSLVGPQPRTAGQFRDCFARGPECLLARPGLTGIWRIYRPSPRHGRAEIALDRYYVRNWSLRLDLALMSKVILATYRDDRAA
jgi:exopolysaccharide production protein ExoY